MFFRKIYYNSQTGDVIANFMMNGNVHFTSKSEDAAMYPEINNAGDNVGLLSWTTEDVAVEENLKKATSISVDVLSAPHKLVYDYTPVKVQTEPDATQMEIALNLLGVKTEEEKSNEN